MVVAVALAACSSDDVDGVGSSDPGGVPSVAGTAAPSGVEPDGFTTIQATITDADGEECDVCLWLADTAEERARGLMGVTDLGDADGMAFRFEQPTAGSFYMFQTPTPLSIAWFAPAGELLATADMAPCLDTPVNECELYSPGGEYDIAVEVFQGDLAALGIGSGARIELIEGTEADRCPLRSD